MSGARLTPAAPLAALVVLLDNASDADYETAGALNFNAVADPIAVERFVAPGAPIAGFAGVRVRF